MRTSQVTNLIDVCRKANRVPFIWGERGIGKSDIVDTYCKEKGIQMIDLRLGTQEVGDLVGIPRSREINGKHRTVFSKPEWWPEVGTEGILFLDEFNRASTADVLQAMFQLVLGNKEFDENGKKKIVRKMHTHVLPDGWTIVCAGNPESSDYMVQSLDTAMLDRFVQVEVLKNVKDCRDWMKVNLKEEEIHKFIAQNNKALGENERINIIVKPSPRSWEFLDDLLAVLKEDEALYNSLAPEIMKGCVGEEIASLFFKHLNDNYMKPLTATEIMGTRNWEKFVKEKLPKYLNDKGKKRTELLKLTLEDIQKCMKEKALPPKAAENVVNFISIIPPDLAISFIEEAIQTENCKSFILKLKDPKYNEFLYSAFATLGFSREVIDEAEEKLKEIINQEKTKKK